MLLQTFLHLPGVGEIRERRIWMEGVESWDDYLASPPPRGVGERLKKRHDRMLIELKGALGRGQWHRFSTLLPHSHRWRLFDPLGERAAYLDIESDGLGPGAVITVVGIYTKGRYIPLVRGYNLTRGNIEEALKDSSMLVTFNGTSFDLPMIEKHYPGVLPPLPHLDLMHTARKTGLKGGLKAVERALGIEREVEVAEVNGEVAVRLWRLWERERSRGALKLLLKYNKEDVKNLEPLARRLYEALKAKTLF
ncbi:MAG: exonuclease [Thermoplasmata archaeon]|nr:MAG: exonuclease [Thermoplasmata archaeon]